jgi:hypothetical protein
MSSWDQFLDYITQNRRQYINFFRDCSTFQGDAFKNSKMVADILEAFNTKCVGHRQCLLDIDPNTANDKCMLEIIKRFENSRARHSNSNQQPSYRTPSSNEDSFLEP